MNQSQNDLRRAAADEFMEALEQLRVSLAAEEKKNAQPVAQPIPNPAQKIAIPDPVQAFEDAVADIEQFIQSQREREG